MAWHRDRWLESSEMRSTRVHLIILTANCASLLLIVIYMLESTCRASESKKWTTKWVTEVALMLNLNRGYLIHTIFSLLSCFLIFERLLSHHDVHSDNLLILFADLLLL